MAPGGASHEAGPDAGRAAERGADRAGAPLLTLTAFGDLEVHLGGIRLDAWPRRKAKLALAALMLSPRGRTAIELAELLADGEPSQAALTTVQVSISALRRVLEPDLAKGQASRYVVMRDERYMLDPALVAGCDVPAFEGAIARARQLQRTDAAGAAAAYAEAAARYRGPLLADAFFQRWFEAERERARADALEAQLYLADHALGRGDEADAEAALARAAAIMPHDEGLTRRLMAHHADRKRAERVRCAYWDYRKALKATLGLAPDDGFERDYQAALARAGT